MPSEPYSALTPYLHPGERLLWAGRPKRGLLLRGEDAFLIPFSLIWSLPMFPGAFSALVSGGGEFDFFNFLFAIALNTFACKTNLAIAWGCASIW